jgi:CRP/FNR family transcriptional regulator, cyclic AMP receptor protein
MQHTVSPARLADIPLFCGLSAAELDHLTRAMWHATFFAGATLIAADDLGEHAYLIRSGTVKIHALQPDGRDVVLAVLGPHQIVGEMSLVDGHPRCASAVAMEECAALGIERQAFQDCLLAMPRLTHNLTLAITRRLRLANLQIQALVALDLRARVARQLLALADAYGQRRHDGTIIIPIRLTQSDLADLVGSSRFRLNQILVELRQYGIVATSRDHRITIHDAMLLVQLASGIGDIATEGAHAVAVGAMTHARTSCHPGGCGHVGVPLD